MSKEPLILTPDNPAFYDWLNCTLPPGWREQVTSDFDCSFVARKGNWLLEPLEGAELEEYLYGGELEEVELESIPG